MLHFARFAAILVVIWFFMSAKDKGEQPIKWAVIGLIGYWLAWWGTRLTVVAALSGTVGKSAMGIFLVMQIPAVVAILASILIRKKLMADVAEN
jgi:GTPase